MRRCVSDAFMGADVQCGVARVHDRATYTMNVCETTPNNFQRGRMPLLICACVDMGGTM